MNNNDKTTRSNMGYFLACRTNVTSSLRLLKHVICYTKLVFSLKWFGLSAGEISQLNTIAHISTNIRIQENGLILPNTPWWDLLFGTLKRTKFQNIMVLYLPEINSSLKWRLLYMKNFLSFSACAVVLLCSLLFCGHFPYYCSYSIFFWMTE